MGGDKNTKDKSRKGKRILGNSVYSDGDNLTQTVTEYLREEQKKKGLLRI